VQTQAVELADTASSSFLTGTNDGLVGLAFSSINTGMLLLLFRKAESRHVETVLTQYFSPVQPQPQSTFFDNAQPSLSAPQFAAYLPYQTSGAYDFGALDSSKYTGTVQYAPVDSSGGFWQFTSDSYQVGSQTFSASGTVGIAGMFIQDVKDTS
jgi:aspergillopepsin I